MRVSKLVLALVIFVVLAVAMAACVQPPPTPEEPAGGPGIVRDLNVPGALTARMATIRDSLTVNGAASVGDLSAGSLNLRSGELEVDALTVNGLQVDYLIAEVAGISDTLIVSNVLVIGDMGVSGMIYPQSNYYPLALAGSVTGSQTITDVVSAVLVPVEMTVGAINYFARTVTGTVACNVIYTTVGITPTQNTIADNVTLTAGSVVTDIVQNGMLGAGYLLELGCSSGIGEGAEDVLATIWFQ